MRIMGLDVGSKTVGVAISDPFGWTAQGIEIIPIDEANGKLALARVRQLAIQHDVTKIVIGLPKNMNNSLGFRAQASMNYGEKLKEVLPPNITITFTDERLTTVQAERMLVSEGNVSRKKRKKVIDKLAAVLLLQNYLDRHPQDNEM